MHLLPPVDLLLSAAQSPAAPLSDIELLEKSLLHVTELLDTALDYVQSVLAGTRKGDQVLGRYLMDTLGANVEDVLEKGSFHTGLQVLLFQKQS
jgi:translation initiation factor 3 subunit F